MTKVNGLATRMSYTMEVLFLKLFLMLLLVLLAESIKEGDNCTKEGAPGVCTNIRNCPDALHDIKIHKAPQLCVFLADPIVCCVSSSSSSTSTNTVTTAVTPVLTTSSAPASSTTEVIDDYSDFFEAKGQCEPVSSSLAAPPNGQLAWDKCVEYQSRAVYPCVWSPVLGANHVRTDRCHHDKDQLGGTSAAVRDELPYLVALGYGSKPARLWWLCSGALVSEKFVLTAAHCTNRHDVGAVTYVQLDALQLSALIPRNRRRVKKIHSHPDYDPPYTDHNIALIELQRPAPIDEYTVPACLHTAAEHEADEHALTTGWGLVPYRTNTSDFLQKTRLTKFTAEECTSMYLPDRFGWSGFDNNSQLCYGDRDGGAKTCQFDGGSPLVIKNKKIACMYTVIGVAVDPAGCSRGESIFFTRVATYRGWIEKIVWPELSSGSYRRS